MVREGVKREGRQVLLLGCCGESIKDSAQYGKNLHCSRAIRNAEVFQGV